jgi:hypothetical protein
LSPWGQGRLTLGYDLASAAVAALTTVLNPLHDYVPPQLVSLFVTNLYGDRFIPPPHLRFSHCSLTCLGVRPGVGARHRMCTSCCASTTTRTISSCETAVF